MAHIETIDSAVQVEIEKIKGSRFVADIAPAADEAEAMAFVQSIRDEFPDAGHHCFAWRIDEERTRSSDDGEPTGTAGLPILKRLVGEDLQQVVLVVTRWFGGTKLGTGGLVRAYGAAARAALDEAVRVQVPLTDKVVLRFDYGLSGVVASVLRAHGLEGRESFGADVTVELRVPVEQVDGFLEEIGERGAGKIGVEREDGEGT